MSTAVWMVMCSEPMMRAPASGWASANSARVDMRPGISCSASSISLRPKRARERSATLKSSGDRVMWFLHGSKQTWNRLRVVGLEPAGSPVTALVAERPVGKAYCDAAESGHAHCDTRPPARQN